MKDYKKELQDNCFCEIRRDFIEDDLKVFAEDFGRIVPGARGEIIQPLYAREKNEGVKGSFSYVCGLGEFPWHSDTSFWDVPVRYLMLTSMKSSLCPTNYISYKELLNNEKRFEDLAQRAVFSLRHPSYRQCVPFQFKVGSQKGYRYDAHLMVPYNKAAEILDAWIKEKLDVVKPHSIYWKGDNITVIDNWLGIHNRADANGEPERKLLRLYINP